MLCNRSVSSMQHLNMSAYRHVPDNLSNVGDRVLCHPHPPAICNQSQGQNHYRTMLSPVFVHLTSCNKSTVVASRPFCRVIYLIDCDSGNGNSTSVEIIVIGWRKGHPSCKLLG